jgi:transcriptional regulatory protein degU
MSTKLVIVDDHAMYRVGAVAMLRTEMPEVEIVGDFGSGQALIDALQGGLEADIALVDVVMPEMSGVQLAGYLLKNYPNMAVLMISSEATPDIATELIELGVHGYTNKTAPKEDMVMAIRTVLQGETYFGRRLPDLIYEAYMAQRETAKHQHRKLFSKPKPSVEFTPCELEVIKLLCSGKTVAETAEQLNYSMRTIENYKSEMLKRLGYKSVVELLRYALQYGLIRL